MAKPKLRFPEFIDEWEQRKLSDIAVYKNGKGHEDKQSDTGYYELVNLNSISIDGGLKPSGKFISEAEETLLINDLVMVLSDVGHGDLLGRVALIPENNRFVLNQRVALLRIIDDTCPKFLFSSINSNQVYFKKLGAGSSQLNISKNVVEDFPVFLPCIDEQKKISGLFVSLDNTITLHQRELSNLEKQKKAVMQKIFSKKVRFKKDDGSEYPEWKTVHLADIATRVTRKNKNNETDIPLTISSIDGLVDQRTYFGKTVASRDMTNYYLLKKGEFAYNKSYSVGFDFGSIKRLDKFDQGALSTLYICFALKDPKLSNYMTCYFNSLVWNKEMPMICAEGARNHGLLNVSASDFFSIEIQMPQSLEEQQKIADFLFDCDKAIDLSRQELEKWKMLKKGLLQQMFV